MRSRIGTQVILGVGLVTALAIGLMAAAILPAQRAAMIAQITRSADQLSDTVKNGARDSMLENRRDNLQRQMEAIGRQAGIEKVRLFNKEGRMAFSSDRSEIGRSLDKKAEACYACHSENRPLERLPIVARSRIFRGPDGGRVLGIINPIQNDASCVAASCHAHTAQQTVLGVLDVSVSLAEVDRQIARSQAGIAGLAALALAASGLLLWWLNRRLVVRPVQALAAGTRRVAQGDLTTVIPVTARHELGDLARAFNAMTRQLADAQRQLAQADKLSSVGRLAAGVAHEINNPLTGVLTYASFLLNRAEGNAELKQDLEVIVRETKRCREIVKGLLDFARQTPPRRQPTDPGEVARRSVAVVMNQLALRHVALTLDLSEDLPRVPADPNQLQQVIVNLLLNAADAIGEAGGHIRLAAARAAVPPWGHARIARATCPKGCDLLDSGFRIGGMPAIRVARVFKGKESLLHLDPVYGRFNHHAAEAHEEGIELSYLCPWCRVSLDRPERRCDRCGAALFAVLVPGAGAVEWCARKGCHVSRWEARDAAGPKAVVEVVVEDDGQGIPPEAMRHLFEPFFSTKGPRGTGLGLAVTWGIVEGHCGTIEVWSEPGRGSRFTVRLPLEPGEGMQAAA